MKARMVREGNITTVKGSVFVDLALEIWDFLKLYEYKSEKEESKVIFTPIYLLHYTRSFLTNYSQ